MKHLLLIPLLALLAGCVTSKQAGGLNVRAEAAGWTADVSALVLAIKPEYKVPMQAVVTYLDAAEGAGSLDLGAISLALSKLPFLQSRDSKIGLIGSRLILRRSVGDLELQTPDTIRDVGLGIRDGLKVAMAGG